jgi:hypothetical protein
MIRRLLAGMVLLSLIGSGCGGDGDEASGGTWISLLERIPAGEETLAYVMLNDFAAARELAGVTVPGADATDDQLKEYLLALSTGPVSDPDTVPVTRSPAMAASIDTFGQGLPILDEWRTQLGITVLDVDRSALAGYPPNELIVWEGDIDPDRVEAAVTSDPDWSGDLETIETAGGSYYLWGGDPIRVDTSRTSTVRPLGRGGCLHASDGVALRTISDGTMEAALAVSEDAPTLADFEPLRLIADALDEQNTYGAYLTIDPGQYIPDPSVMIEGAEEQTTLLPYLALGTGPGVDEAGEAYMVLVLVHEDADTAAANVALLGEIVATGVSVSGTPWSELLTVRSIETDGPLLVAVLETGTRANIWYRIVFMRDTLLTWS